MLTTTIQRTVRSSHVFLITSVVIHALLLCIPLASSVVSKQTVPQNRLFAVELIVPEPEENTIPITDKTDPPPALLATPPLKKDPIQKSKTEPEPEVLESPPVPPREATVSLDRLDESDLEYRTYLGHLRSKIGVVWDDWEYPAEVRDKGLNGTVTLRMCITRDGRLQALNITKHSPHQLLDSEALQMIRDAGPFMPFPSEFSIEKLNVSVSFVYEFNTQ